ncbi:hypothetical protein KM043_007646 [Ampulex compressa]|nr:hypothetical protein KM043_007646 [Ampulex compressa]
MTNRNRFNIFSEVIILRIQDYSSKWTYSLYFYATDLRSNFRPSSPHILLSIEDTTSLTVLGINIGIGGTQLQSIGSLWTQTTIGDLESSFKTKKFPCPNCASAYSQKYSLNRHLTYECGQEPRFKCPHCDYRCKKSANIYEHVRRRHKNCRVYAIDILKTASTGDS